MAANNVSISSRSFAGSLFGPLQDLAVFNAVTLDAEAGTLVWPNGTDFDPATLRDWPNVVDELYERSAHDGQDN